MKILIVEDDLMIADLLEETLVSTGYEVCGIAQTATVAVELAHQHKPTLAIIDVNLGAGELGTVIPHRLEAVCPVGILFATGNGHMDQLSGSGGTAIINKPYSMADMLLALWIVQDIVVAGTTTRSLPSGMRLLPGAQAFSQGVPTGLAT